MAKGPSTMTLNGSEWSLLRTNKRRQSQKDKSGKKLTKQSSMLERGLIWTSMSELRECSSILPEIMNFTRNKTKTRRMNFQMMLLTI